MVRSICKEIELQSDFLGHEKIETIYFGGGTPSLLHIGQLAKILEKIQSHFQIIDFPETTIECNPDDLSNVKLSSLRKIGFNRLSVGIQSFNDNNLKYLHRLHSSNRAIECIHEAKNCGFQNISIDLIFGIPASDISIWEKDICTAMELQPQHISSYCLTIEPNTVFGKWKIKGKIMEYDEDKAANEMNLLIDLLDKDGFKQYEVSNFSLAGFESKHNTSYWLGKKYLGIGPGAHSYNGSWRQFNIQHNHKYIKSIMEGTMPAIVEKLNIVEKANEFIMTSLRTKWGMDLSSLEKIYPVPFSHQQLSQIEEFRDKGLLTIQNGTIFLTKNGMLLADEITSCIFFD